ncbi:uncharacterized protein MELLADRAFT_96105 [Melampsora larici-populina 98AG31]|uniref:Uncharacterized protein n=1 Tax=Melampsora larici-populina (strain 98AG31 / pathotype 3-4-7) TaxID=747676 RepID=F4SAZ3_MELLP|nr:uncharacterized protein MELLADRAFT_96105 [Melampsora larici-populina 98AG31]EGF98198.1 hypothetical protein MELLADRAFT_96105 [Melampsora larici-populina 98AG31]
MQHMVLQSDIAPRLRWMGQVGRAKVFLVNSQTWQAFVDLLSKATKHKGCVTIFSESQKEKARKVAQACAAKELITSASGPSASKSEVRVLTKELEPGNSGDRVVLVCPWDPKILYRLTWSGAWVWAKAVQAGMATREIPPRTYEYLAIMKKSRVYHKAMKVDDRVKMQSGNLHLDLSPTFNKAGGSHQSFFEPPAKLLFQKPMAGGSKRSAIFSISDDGERNDKKKIKVEPGMLTISQYLEYRNDKKKIKVEPGFEDEKRNIEPTKRITIVLSSDPPSPSPIIKREPGSPSGYGNGMAIMLSSDSPKPEIFSSQVTVKNNIQNEPAGTMDLAPVNSDKDNYPQPCRRQILDRPHSQCPIHQEFSHCARHAP